MIVSLHLRRPISTTNFRCQLFADGMEAAGHKVVTLGRGDAPDSHAGVVMQTGFSNTHALRVAIDRGIPYIIGEGPAYRHTGGVSTDTHVSYGWNGLMGGAFFSPPPSEERWKPELKPFKTGGDTIIFAQKPNDHSLRGHDHIKWLQEKLIEFPDAEFRPHPLMTDRTLEPIQEALDRCYRAVTYSSTTGAEAIIEGCLSEPEHWGSPGAGADLLGREKWLHAVSWSTFSAEECATAAVGEHILSGFDMARARARNGLVETPRPKKMKDSSVYPIDDPRVREASA